MPPLLEGYGFPVGCAVVPGGVAGALSPVSGLANGDTLIEVRHVSDDLVTNASILGESTITDDGEITTTTTNTTGNHVIVVWKKAA